MAPRYAKIAQAGGLPFVTPAGAGSLTVAHRLPGNSGTDFGVPGLIPPEDTQPIKGEELARLLAILRACWSSFDATVTAARGKELAKGPRGGGRELDGIVEHVQGAEASYAGQIDLKLPQTAGVAERRRAAILDRLAEIGEAGILPPGPRGGARWSARYFARRAAYHIVDHIWEIEDRAR